MRARTVAGSMATQGHVPSARRPSCILATVTAWHAGSKQGLVPHMTKQGIKDRQVVADAERYIACALTSPRSWGAKVVYGKG